MCVSVEVTLPTIQTFLLLFSLRFGCLVILIWTSFRSCFGVIFCTSAILEVLLRRSSPPGSWIASPNKKYYLEGNFYVIYYLYVSLMIVEAILLLFSVVHLAWGLYKLLMLPLLGLWAFFYKQRATLAKCEMAEATYTKTITLGLCRLFGIHEINYALNERSRPLKQYLICRTFTWIAEGALLLSLCLNNKQLIGWYLVLLLFVILEFYSLITVYSHYVNIVYMEIDPQNYPEKVQQLYNFCTNPKSLEKLQHSATQLDKVYSYRP